MQAAGLRFYFPEDIFLARPALKSSTPVTPDVELHNTNSVRIAHTVVCQETVLASGSAVESVDETLSLGVSRTQ